MRSTAQYLALAGALFMLLAAIVFPILQGFNVTGGLEPAPVRLYLEPAGYAFVIWAFIYMGFTALAIYQFQPRLKDDPVFVRARPYLLLNGIVNALWFVGVFFQQIWFTALCMLTLLYTLIQLSLLLELGKAGKSWQEKLFIKLPIALYFGWITAATPINVTSALIVDFGLTGREFLGPEIWSILLLVVAVAIFLLLYVRQYANGTYLMVGIWALLAIYVANTPESQPVGFAALIFAGILIGVLTFLQLRKSSTYVLL